MSDAPKLAIVGAGAIGRGWASLSASHGWFTALYDPEARAIDSAIGEIQRRVKALVALGRANRTTADIGLSRLRVGRSLLQACGDADWIIEAATEDLPIKQRIFENIEQVAQKDALISSCSSGLAMTEIGARCRDQTRLVVTHPLNPPELIPLIEVVPGKFTSKATVEDTCDRLRALGRFPIALNREVKGNLVGRISAAVYRECIALVLEGVVDVDQVDRAVSLGPSLGWAAAGPHLTYHLGAGEGGLSAFLQHLLQSFEVWWGSLATWQKLEPEQVRALTAMVEKAYGSKLETIRESRDRRLASILQALERARRDSASARLDE
ncbi:MAG TPA: 3-hydroxyacyl-CoA dehydrogenase NAD-binding domain-containing protein [Dongiaceae bacterium]|nr:3-hydroxyacyl-CoA dehydrogenase NAD-binding domain-containing protein [Dongiaceae bacterium]